MSSTVSLPRVPLANRTPAPATPLLLFCAAHFVIDMYSIGLGVLQPLLLERYSLSLTQAGFLAGMLVFSSSLLQPVYGFLSDRFHTRMFTVLAPATAGIFLSTLGWAPGYWTLMAMVFLGGAGVASFHPQATANATAGVETNRGRAMAVFISSGTLGLALGPTYFSLITARVGLEGAWVGAFPGILITVVLFAMLRLPHSGAGTRGRFELAPLLAVWKPITLLFLCVFIRSIVQITFAQFLPLYLKLERGFSLPAASAITSIYLLGGAAGGFLGGHLADRLGGRFVIRLSMVASVPFLVLFVFAPGWISIGGLIVGGAILLFTIPVNVVMGQQLVPSQAGTVSALMMGFAWGAAGLLFIPLTGWVSDHYSMETAFAGLVLFPLLGFWSAWKLPDDRRA
ncbi:MAG: MFS transporter [Bryobacterales bacterium]|nr:MFS transporter [Bryobacterales bacterium]